MPTSKLTFGRDLRVGDTIDVWWGTHRDTVISLRTIDSPLAALAGARIAEFAVNQRGMTIPADTLYEVFHRRAEAA